MVIVGEPTDEQNYHGNENCRAEEKNSGHDQVHLWGRMDFYCGRRRSSSFRVLWFGWEPYYSMYIPCTIGNEASWSRSDGRVAVFDNVIAPNRLSSFLLVGL